METWTDPIIEETRTRRAEYARQFDSDLEAMDRDLKERERKRGRTFASLSPRPPEPHTSSAA